MQILVDLLLAFCMRGSIPPLAAASSNSDTTLRHKALSICLPAAGSSCPQLIDRTLFEPEQVPRINQHAAWGYCSATVYRSRNYSFLPVFIFLSAAMPFGFVKDPYGVAHACPGALISPARLS